MNKVKKLKKKARKHYNAYFDAIEPYDCGIALAEHLSATASTSKRLYNETVDKLKEADPTFPKGKEYYL